MGHRVSIEITGMIIPKDKIADCLSTLAENIEVSNTGNIVQAFASLNHDGYMNDGGDFKLEGFTGEKWRDQEEIYHAIAPFVVSGDYPGVIQCLGEEGDNWRFVFRDGEVKGETGELVWR